MVIQNPVINSTANIAAYMKLLMHFSPYTMHICPPEHSYIVPLSFFLFTYTACVYTIGEIPWNNKKAVLLHDSHT